MVHLSLAILCTVTVACASALPRPRPPRLPLHGAVSRQDTDNPLQFPPLPRSITPSQATCKSAVDGHLPSMPNQFQMGFQLTETASQGSSSKSFTGTGYMFIDLTVRAPPPFILA